jgi:hypothetical protein
MRGRIVAAVIGVTLVSLVAAACGGDSKSDAAKTASASASTSTSTQAGGPPSLQHCIDEAVAALNSVDLTGVSIDDGLDDVEKERVNSQADAMQRAHPAIADGGPCETTYGKLSDEDNAAIAARVDPTVLAAVAEAASTKFETVGSSIN